MTLAPAGAWAGQTADLISLADLVMLHMCWIVPGQTSSCADSLPLTMPMSVTVDRSAF